MAKAAASTERAGASLFRRPIVMVIGLVLAALAVSIGWQVFYNSYYDEGQRFSNELATFGARMQNSNRTDDDFTYTPYYGVDQDYSVLIGASRYCPNPPCEDVAGDDMSGVANVYVQHGTSGSGYSFKQTIAVPKRLFVRKHGAPVRVHLLKRDGIVEAVAID